MLTCKQFMAELSDYLDEALGREERKKLEEHINACPNCWVIADTTRKTVTILFTDVEASTDLRTRLMKALERKMASKRV